MKCKFKLSQDFARDLDKKDPLSRFRNRFYMPKDLLYMDGNSLGLLSIDAEESLMRVLNEFKELGINGWLDGNPPWFTFAEELGNKQAPLVGADKGEVIVHGSTTTNLHNLIASFFKPTVGKNKILIDELNFPSDKYAVESQLILRGLEPASHLKIIKSRDGVIIDEADIINEMTQDVALVLLPSVLYRSGQLLNMELLTKEAHHRHILIGFDCSHSVGAVPHYFSPWGVDFAVWCNYKYLNNGPGGTASLYVNKKHFGEMPGLWGWWGYNKEKQFDMNLDFEPANNAGRWQISTVNLFSTAPLEGSLNIFLEAGIENIREKSIYLTEYMIYLVQEILSGEPYNLSIVSPLDTQRRGGHVALSHSTEAIRINEALKKRGVIPDFRYPNIIRLAPIALYNTYLEIWTVVQHIKNIIDTQEYRQYSTKRSTVS